MQFTVEARDHGIPPLRATVPVTLTITPAQAVRFVPARIELTLPENQTVGSSVTKMSAEDPLSPQNVSEAIWSNIVNNVTVSNVMNKVLSNVTMSNGSNVVVSNVPVSIVMSNVVVLSS